MTDEQLSMISRERAERAVPTTDCSGREYSKDEWEDLVRTILHGAEIQRDHDKAIKLGTTPDVRNKDFTEGRRYQHQEDVEWLDRAMGLLAIDEERPGFVIWRPDWEAFKNMKIE